MDLTLEQVTEMAPDSNSAAAGKKLMALKNWPDVGRDDHSLWGKCQGSKVYQIMVDLSNLGYKCNCPSRKFPCKHVLGLLMLTASSPDAVAEATRPEWVDDWLKQRQARAEKKAEVASTPKKPVDEKAKKRRAAKREKLVTEGLSRLDLWMKDLVRTGLAGVEAKPHSFWDEQAKRLVDSQAGGLASRVSRWAEIPGSSRDWPKQLLTEFGRVKLLLKAFERIEQLTPELQSDVRQIIGWNIGKDELSSDGEKVEDSWIVAGQWIDDDGRIRSQRSWVFGRKTDRTALVLQFAVGGQPFAESIVPGTEQVGTLVFYPGASKQRAKFVSREGELLSVQSRVSGSATIDEFLGTVSDALATQPWLDAFGCVLHDVTLIPGDEWTLRDRNGAGLPVRGRDHWKTLAVTGGHPVDLVGEWDGHQIRLLNVFNDRFQHRTD
ncbi:SWIM zinc finger family protein [Thalassoroseus pseudoceratinae]|uniref:SWIM zinc finger family protein n=1 Tax=Thalassoroseus pseudoceratinae TaxID=2713176 RepID=UPI00141F910C|nr:SWIM zinc finger family protein [Thalassoroseus pseudoceratinae]